MKFYIDIKYALLFILWINFGSNADARWISSGDKDPGFNHKDLRAVKVDYFVLAMEWPQGTCEHINATSHHSCVVSDSVHGWVLHGLWPSIYGSKYLVNCNNSVKFDYNKIKSMEGDLMKYWPNMFKDTGKKALWKHEYEKHGTCAAHLKGFETEVEYFQHSMQLLQKYQPMQILQDSNIVPSVKPYQGEDIFNALKSGFGTKTCTQCSSSDGTKVLSQVEVCLDMALGVMDCPRCGTQCDGSVYYHPIHFKP